MNDKTPTFTGTPDDWWHQSTPITEAEAADRPLGNWYITRVSKAQEQGSAYRVATPTLGSNEPRKAKLRRDIAAGRVKADDYSTSVRRLIEVELETPAWLEADLVMADSEIGSDERVLWRRAGVRWHKVFDGRGSVGERTMLHLHAAVATVTEEKKP